MILLFQENQVRNLLRERKPEFIIAGLPLFARLKKITEVMVLLGNIQNFLEARTLSEDDLKALQDFVIKYLIEVSISVLIQN